MNNTGKIIIGVAAGAAVGAFLGILFAPDKGTETRRKIYRKGQEYMDDVRDKFDDFKESVSGKFDEVKDATSEFAEKSRRKADKLRKDVNTSMN